MQCPVCKVELTMTDRQGIEIDYCAKCRGVWLDRGELDKIIERSMPERSVEQPEVRQPRGYVPGPEVRDYRRSDDDDDYYRDRDGYRRRKRRSFLGDLFDFD